MGIGIAADSTPTEEKIMAENGTVAYVATIPMCDVHDKSHPAAFDAAVQMPGWPRRVWANVCEAAFEEGRGRLGTGLGQRLEVRV